MASEQNDIDRAKELVALGSDLVGAGAGGAIGLIGGPPGAVGGAIAGVAVTRTLRRVGSELVERVMGPRQRVRVGAAFTVAAEEINARLERGEIPREDGFFATDETARSTAEELLEGVLLTAADAYEERKVEYLGLLYSSFAFDPGVDAGEANFLIRIAEGLTYRQLCAIAFFARPLQPGHPIFQGRRDEPLFRELDDLAQDAILGFRRESGAVARPSTTLGGGDFGGIAIDQIALTALGQRLYDLMRLHRLPANDVDEIAATLGARLPSNSPREAGS